MCVNDKPYDGTQHRTPVHGTGPVHQVRGQVVTGHARETEDGDHQAGEAGGHHAHGEGKFAQVPGSATEAFAHEKGPDGDGDREGNKGRDGPDGEDGPDGHLARKDQQGGGHADGHVEPDRVHGRAGVAVDAGPVSRQRETAVTGVREGDSRGRHHAALAHGEGTNDGQGQNGQSGVARHALKEICGPRLTQVRIDHVVDVDHRVCHHQLEEPTH